MPKTNYWDLTNRPHTKLKLEIYEKYLKSWCQIFKKQAWAKDVFIVDCFAGKGDYLDNGAIVDGSPLITIKTVKEINEDFKNNKVRNKDYFKIKCFFIEENSGYANNLTKLLEPYKKDVEFEIINDDFNKVIARLVKDMANKPALFFIDPYGIKSVNKSSILSVINKPGAKDILFNYINEGVIRIAGLAKKVITRDIDDITVTELKTIKHLQNFIGDKFLELIDKNDIEILKYYVDNILKSNNNDTAGKNNLDVIGFDMPYPNKSDTIYYLLFASRNKQAMKIVSQVYANSKKENLQKQKSLFDSKEQLRIHKDFKV
ncbi:MAG: three-Cys-motif partner protein TcmP [Candidatus Parcubacteria bacterium]|nr:three-Cys-motif partner protein TcmP [Candidatus Parcubacteria bacterium]